MPLPLILAGAALLAGGYGVKKGFDAKGDFEKAERIGKRARRNYQDAEEHLSAKKKETNDRFVQLGKLKVLIFSNQIKHLVEVLRRHKPTTSKLRDFDIQLSTDEIHEMEKLVLGSLEIEKGIASGAATGALAGIGAIGAVGALGTASTGTAISTLGGAAAYNATVAWFGGGAIGAGGFGMGVGAYAIGGIVLGPALAVGGFMMAKKAEEAVTSAYEYEAKVDAAIAEMNKLTAIMDGLQKNVLEMERALQKLAARFDQAKVSDLRDERAFQTMVIIGKGLKGLLDLPVMETDGRAVAGLTPKIRGFLELA